MKAHIGLFVLALCASCAARADDAKQGPANGSTGGPAAYMVTGKIAKLPRDGRPAQKIAFPEISDWRSLKIELQRGMCLGPCPYYHVEIDGDGTVSYEGLGFVAVAGVHRTQVPVQDVRDLFAALRKAEFFWLLDSYRAPITDFPDYSVTIAFDGHARSVDDYVGPAVGMPKEVRDLEEAIDRIAGTKRWVVGDDTTFASLKAEGWDFRAGNEANAKLLQSAAESGSLDLLQALLDAGVPSANQAGCHALDTAAYKGDVAKVRMLLAAHAPVDVQDAQNGTCAPLTEAAQRGNAAIVTLLIDAHADANARDGAGQTALMNSGDPGVVAALLAAGADPYLKDNDGKTALDMAGPHDETRPVLERWMAEHPQN